MLSRENKAFDQVRRKTQDTFNQVENGQRDWLKAAFWQAFHEELQRAMEARLTSFRSVSQVADEVAKNVASDAERLREDPTTRGEASDAAAFYLDSEVLRDDRGGQRLWHKLFSLVLDKTAYYNEAQIFSEISDSFQPAVDKEGRIRAKDAIEIVRDLRTRLEELARTTLGQVLAEKGLNLKTALELEARLIHAKGSDEAAIEAVSDTVVQNHVRDKFTRVIDQCVVLANIDKTKLDDPTVKPAHIFYVGLAPIYAGDDGGLRSAIRQVATGVDFIDGWGEEDMIVFYRAMLGIPLYFYKRINDELYQSYRTVKAKPNRSYPLHIEAAWEDGVPNIDPKEVREAEEKRRAEQEAQARLSERSDRLWAFVLAGFAGSVERTSAGAYEWVVGTVHKRLGGDRATAFNAFWALDPALRDDLVKAGQRRHAEQSATVVGRRAVKSELESHLGFLTEQLALALANEEEALTRYLKDEKRIVEERLAAMADR